jgi:hypothetical protein
MSVTAYLPAVTAWGGWKNTNKQRQKHTGRACNGPSGCFSFLNYTSAIRDGVIDKIETTRKAKPYAKR